ncbi:DUF2080 family transposase-associated protein [Methanobrevibacter filiformis]|uniref:Uncharacterized protein n=1 Tax=Methanobrevibacter filiformis TaxID=55758 RepID=A0A166FB13_9EURY|nr:DUF2080 family transposase-associated protein [Methanobrevibacter filiformis]KZX17485.1 hypothetical protein MBFIL_01430 [Methanobrevibacter filiformis]
MKTSQYPNVYYNKNTGKWTAELKRKGKTILNESFDNEYDAHLAVEEKMKLENIMIKTVKPVGGTAHVLVPRKWIGREVQIILLD